MTIKRQSSDYQGDEGFKKDKRHDFRREKAVKECSKKRKTSKIKNGIDHYYTSKEMHQDELDGEDFDMYDDSQYH